MSVTTAQRRPNHDDLDDYNIDDFDDPFRSPSPKPDDNGSKKRKEAGGLGIDEEVSVAKRARVPRVKLDESRLLADNGIPKLRKRARDLKFKGKGHEFSDAARLLSFYQFWLDDLFPKAKFLDALGMVEKTGHKRIIASKRMEWINERKPKDTADRDGSPTFESGQQEAEGAIAKEQERRKTPDRDDMISDDDIYDASPRVARPAEPPKPLPTSVDPDEDDLEALMAEAELESLPQQTRLDKPATMEQHDFAEDEAAMAEMDGLW